VKIKILLIAFAISKFFQKCQPGVPTFLRFRGTLKCFCGFVDFLYFLLHVESTKYHKNRASSLSYEIREHANLMV